MVAKTDEARVSPSIGARGAKAEWEVRAREEGAISDSQMLWLRPIPGAVRTEDPQLGRLMVQQEKCLSVLELLS